VRKDANVVWLLGPKIGTVLLSQRFGFSDSSMQCKATATTKTEHLKTARSYAERTRRNHLWLGCRERDSVLGIAPEDP
jgi:hypothetical protein